MGTLVSVILTVIALTLNACLLLPCLPFMIQSYFPGVGLGVPLHYRSISQMLATTPGFCFRCTTWDRFQDASFGAGMRIDEGERRQ